MNQSTQRVPLSKAIEMIEDFEAYLEEGVDVAEAMVRVFGADDAPPDEASGFRDAIDRYLSVWWGFRGRNAILKERAEMAQKRYRAAESAFKRFKDRLKYYMLRHQQLVFEGSENEFRLQTSGGNPRLELSFATYDLRDAVDESYIKEMEIPDDCYEIKEVYVLNRERLREHIAAGQERSQKLDENGDYTEGVTKAGALKRSVTVRVK